MKNFVQYFLIIIIINAFFPGFWDKYSFIILQLVLFVCMCGIRVLGVYTLGVKLKMDIAGIWLSILIDITIRAIFLTVRFRNKTLKKLIYKRL